MPIGFPVDNTSVYLFDDDMRPVGLEKVPFDEWMLPTSFTRAGFVSFTSFLLWDLHNVCYVYFT